MDKGNHSFKDWAEAVRPWSFPASTMPVMATLIYLRWTGECINWVNGLWALLNIVLFHAAGNVWSDFFDFKRGVDAQDTFGSKTLTEGKFTPRTVVTLAACLLAAASLGGIALWLRTGDVLLWIGLAGLACTVLYPSLKYRAWGDVVIFMAYAFLPTLGTSYVAAGTVYWNVLWVAFPVGLITTAILHANNMRDMRTDARAGIRTLAMMMGERASAIVYCAEVMLPFICIVGCVAGGIFPVYCCLILVVLVPAWGNVKGSLRLSGEGSAAIARLDEMTAKLQLQFSVVLCVSFVLSILLS